ncbi:MAG: hypothetical protein K2G37_00050 [Clostridia bacterium]|nr:hypothetical protein [Clostridia bacterium]MDE7329159.1 hypothetical protein [Clostridia bacterium]
MGDKKRVKENAASAKKDEKEHVSQKPKPAVSNKVKSNKLKLLVTIVARKKTEYFLDLIQSFDVNMQMVALAEGTANARIMGLLGLLDTEKAVIFSVIQESKISDAMSTLEEKFQTIRDGKGIACTIPLTSVIGTLIYGFLSNNKLTVKENK